MQTSCRKAGFILSKEALALVGHMMVARVHLGSFLTGHSLPSLLPPRLSPTTLLTPTSLIQGTSSWERSLHRSSPNRKTKCLI